MKIECPLCVLRFVVKLCHRKARLHTHTHTLHEIERVDAEPAAHLNGRDKLFDGLF